MDTVVKNAVNLLDEISSNKDLVLEVGNYNISNHILTQDENVFYRDVFDGKELVLNNFSNLSLKGNNSNETSILASPRYANVLTFENSNNLKIENLTLGHTESIGYCTGGVLKFKNCKDIELKNLILFGCGTYGIILEDTKNVIVNGTVIKECTYGILEISDAIEVNFFKCKFYNNSGYWSMIGIKNSKSVHFNDCEIFDNYQQEDSYYAGSMFRIINSEATIVKNTMFTNNKVGFLAENEIVASFIDNEFTGNKFDLKKYSYGNMTYPDYSKGEFISVDVPIKSKILYNEQCIKLVEREIIINDSLPSEPVFSGDKSRFVYISPYEWEALGDLRVFNVIKKEDKILMSAKEICGKTSPNSKIKLVKWIDQYSLICIIGPAYGTVSKGGDVYIYDIDESKLELFYKNSKFEEVSDLTIQDDMVALKIIRFNEDFTRYDTLKKVIQLCSN